MDGVRPPGQSQRPVFTFGQHDSKRDSPLNDLQYGLLLNHGFHFVTAPITNSNFRSRVFDLVSHHLKTLDRSGHKATSDVTGSRPDPIVPPLTPEDTGLFPSDEVTTYVGCISPWIDLTSENPVIANVSRQVLNLEIKYASFCGIRSIIIAGPAQDANMGTGSRGLVHYARAIEEGLSIGSSLTVMIHMPMYRETNVLQVKTLSSLSPLPGQQELKVTTQGTKGLELFTSWDSWHSIRTICRYDERLFIALEVPKQMPEKVDLQNRWFAEPVCYLTFGPETFQANKAGFPSLSKRHQNMIFSYMRLKNHPWFLLRDVGPDVSNIMDAEASSSEAEPFTEADFPTLGEASATTTLAGGKNPNAHLDYLIWLESQQAPFSVLETPALTSFQDWLQSPLQPLSDNLESATYEVFEGDRIKYDQYELAITEALKDWKQSLWPTSKEGVIVLAVAGSGRGPLVTRALNAAKTAQVDAEVWAVEKNPNAYVYLLRQNQMKWGGKVKVIKTDMRAWKGPVVSESPETGPVYGKVDILISELLGSFGDNELSPECLDGIQHVLSKPHGISIPRSYTAHLSPISTPKLHADIFSKFQHDKNAFNTPWVVRLFALDFASGSHRAPGHDRIQQAWEFSHPIPEVTVEAIKARSSGGVAGGGGGSMAGSVGTNDHNSRSCHLTFACRTQGVIHGLAGYFESTLYESEIEGRRGTKVELSIHPERIDQKSRDMVSWFPIFFPLRQPLYYPQNTDLEVSMWRQTDDTKVWYEWLVEASTWISPSNRIKVASSELCSSRKVACLM